MWAPPGASSVASVALSGSLGARLKARAAGRFDAVLAAVLCAVGVLEAALSVSSLSAEELMIVALLTLPLAWRRRRPVATAVVVTAVLAAQAALAAQPLFTQTFTGFVCLFIAAYSSGRHARDDAFLLAIAGCGVAVGFALGLHDASVASGALGAATVLGCGAGGRGVRRRVRVREILEAQARELEASADTAAKATAIEERLRIAGDIEDVVSHRVCEMLVQAQVANRLAPAEPARAGEALTHVEAQGREALGEMRRLLGVLRGGDNEVGSTLFPSLSQIVPLVERMRAGGVRIELVLESERQAVPVDVDVAAYRVIEATLRDAVGRSSNGAVRVAVRHVARAVEVEIIEEGSGPAPATSTPPPASATIGIDARIAAFGGELRRDRRRDGAYELRMRLPLQAATSTAPDPSTLSADGGTGWPPPAAEARRRRLRLGPRSRRADVLLVVVLMSALAAEAATVSAREGSVVANAVAGVLVGASLLARHRFPLRAAVAGWSAVLGMTAFLTPATETAAVLAVILLLSYATGAHAPRSRAWAGLAIGLIGVTALSLLAPATPQSDDLVFPALLIALAWLVGRVIRAEGALAAEVAQRAQRIERARENDATMAAAQERERMARELHDVVAHALTIMVVQAAGARRTLERAPGRALQAITAVEQAGREALSELRRLLTLVHPTEASALLAPQPGLAQVEALVERTRAGGLPIQLRIEGAPVSLPGGLDLAAYRVVQEALTNTLRHAGPARATVTIRYGNRRLLLKIQDDGRGTSAAHEPGHGIAGMRERVRLYGGNLVAGARRGGGYEVKATLPLDLQSPQQHAEQRAVEPSRRHAVASPEML